MQKNTKELQELVLASGVREKVKVNQRHLIDKILARYSGEFTIFRELIQNANDAGASCLEIHLKCSNFPKESSPNEINKVEVKKESSSTLAAASLFALFNISKKPTEQPKHQEKDKNIPKGPTWYENCIVSEILVKNNGRLFENEDWNRIRRIAEGNPNQQACGMFGVGFYSVFSLSVCFLFSNIFFIF